ncbi:ABC transporter permease [Euzebya rosea]|uniref:ABC transporter permease n=1 Tax=Euzebya rosea TaxID=2052804 RepID=UPI001F0C854A|nr:ABC transporter permease [Euzebya rosea]
MNTTTDTTGTEPTMLTDDPAHVTDAEAIQAEGSARARLGGAMGRMGNLGLVGAIVLVALVGAVTAPENFLTSDNLLTILRQAAVIGVVTVGMTFVIIGGGIDLSVGALVALASVWATTGATQQFGVLGMVGVALLVGTLAGLVNGVLIAYGRVVSFIATLAMLVSARGLAANISNKRVQLVEVQSFTRISQGDFLGLPNLVWVVGIVFVIGWVLLNRTTFGRHTFAIGGNVEAARLAGINIRRHTMMLYGLSGLCTGIGAILIAARTTTGSSTHGELYELDAIAAVIIGGTLLTGGKGTIVGSALGVFIFTLLQNVFALNNLSTDLQNIAKGLIIVAAVLLQMRSGRDRA